MSNNEVKIARISGQPKCEARKTRFSTALALRFKKNGLVRPCRRRCNPAVVFEVVTFRPVGPLPSVPEAVQPEGPPPTFFISEQNMLPYRTSLIGPRGQRPTMERALYLQPLSEVIRLMRKVWAAKIGRSGIS